MHRSRLVVVLLSVTVLAAGSLSAATTATAASGNIPGGADTRTIGHAVPGADVGACTQLTLPADYPAGTTLVDISGLADLTVVDKVQKARFSRELEKRTVGQTWATWGSPPFTESATPPVLYTIGAESITIRLPRSKTVGMEIEPQPFSIHGFTATLKNKSGAVVCGISVVADGQAGARLLAAVAPKRVKSIDVVSDAAFAIAQLRYKKA